MFKKGKNHWNWKGGVSLKKDLTNYQERKKRYGIVKKCKQCEKEFKALPADIKRGKGKFCSLKCSHEWRKGKPLKSARFKFETDIIQRYKEGESIKEIAENEGCSRSTISNHFKRNNVPKRRPATKNWNKHIRERRRNNPRVRLDNNMGKSIRKALKNKKRGRYWQNLVDYSLKDLILHLEDRFTDKMNWGNYGSYWHIDHIIPKSWFNYSTSQDQGFKKCWGLDNLQPLEAHKNLAKNNYFSGRLTC